MNAQTDERTITLYIPEGVLSELEISLSKKAITLPDFSFSDSVKVIINSTNITLDNLNVKESIYLETKNGNIIGIIQ